MEIYQLRQKLKELYLTCFPEDTESYAEFFVNEKFDGTNCMTLFEGEKLITMLFLVKKKMVLRGTVFDVPYLTAGGTLPEYRGHGLFTSVMRNAMESFHNGGKPFTGLMPFSHEFYELQAFVTHSFYKEVDLTRGKLPLKEVSFDELDEMLAVYNGFMQDKNGWFFRDRAAFGLRLKEIFNEGGKAYGLYRDGEMKGYILTFDDEEIDEYCAYTPDEIFNFDTHFEYVKENVGVGGEQDNMLRICNNKLLLQSIRYPAGADAKVEFVVNDWYLKNNSGAYRLTVKNGRAVVEDIDYASERLSIERFTRLVTGSYVQGDFSEQLEALFPITLNCALDKF